MDHPYLKLIRIEILSLLFGSFLGLFAIVQNYRILLFFSLYLIVISLICNALIASYMSKKAEVLKQLIRAILLFVITTYFIISI